MDTVKLIVQILVAILACLSALFSILLFFRLRWPAPALWGMKLLTSALPPLFILTGAISILIGLVTGSAFIILTGLYVTSVFLIHLLRVTAPPDLATGFKLAFSAQWKDRINSEQKKYFLPGRRTLTLPDVPDPRLQQNISFASIPGSSRQLLCDIWQPPLNVTPSGLAFIYLHGSAFYFLDKDYGTRPLFRHLAAQGHTIMDVAYRLSPETDFMGMVNDVKRAIAWMKENGSRFGIAPERIVAGGGSAGAHLALLAAYTANNPQFSPAELAGRDLSVCGAISLYGTSDLEAVYYHTNQHLTTRSAPGRAKKAVPTKMPQWLIKQMGEDYHRLGMDKGFENAGALAPLLGGHPDECPEVYALFSTATHVHSACPPTLLVHGEHDIMAPVKPTRFLHRRLTEAKVLTVLHILPQTDHAFDLVLPKISPSAHTAFYDVERFLALMARSNQG